MGVLTPLRSLFGGPGEETVYECRRCGTTVEERTETCPQCDSDEIVAYQF